MTDRVILSLRNPQQAYQDMRRLWLWVKAMLIAGHALTLEAKRETRSTAQNALLWARLTDIARDVDWHGQKLSTQDWKEMSTAAIKKQRVVPGIEGGFVVLGASTSKMTKQEMGELLDFLMAFGDQHGVSWGAASLGMDLQDQ